ncbi:CHAP domain-containing protein [Novosphingobium sp.]|uniref:CHAP domain-containing protein n=1 Tax=Novosphingobium sp. TaxID=1874826 RepID=UPI0026102AA5|nr:CHAP domain-containing protein [Novosphingobium sp.]
MLHMLKNVVAALLALLSMFALPSAAQARLQCVTYARQISDVQLSGNARDWWGNAEGRYGRGQAPKAGAVLAFAGTRSMPYGHVAVVRKVVDDRHILIDHANWSRPGMVERGVMAVDVSAAGDWSEVRVWYAPTRSLGLRPSAAKGFIYPHASTSGTLTASAETASSAG